MGMRNALKQSGWITFVLLLGMGWIVLSGLSVFGLSKAGWSIGETVGRTAVSGAIGLLVMAVVLGFAIVLFSELGESEPAPRRFPPE